MSSLDHFPSSPIFSTLTKGTRGDVLVLVLYCLIWQISITVVNSKYLSETRIHHNFSLNEVNMVLFTQMTTTSVVQVKPIFFAKIITFVNLLHMSS